MFNAGVEFELLPWLEVGAGAKEVFLDLFLAIDIWTLTYPGNSSKGMLLKSTMNRLNVSLPAETDKKSRTVSSPAFEFLKLFA
jgi:hypothetical protein